jgi:alkylhydroperoxidase family enzyme
MALALNEIKWSDPILPARPDPAWEAEVKRRGGRVTAVDRRISPSPWVREAGFSILSYRPSAMPERLYRICSLVTAQENACRYCYGANRAYMKILGYSESFISRIERDVQLAELEDRDRACIDFYRNLARSRPRPPAKERDKLIDLGYSPPAVNEMAFTVAICCFYNRVATFVACPPEAGFERLANGVVGRLIGLVAPIMAVLSRVSRRGSPNGSVEAFNPTISSFAPVIAPLANLPSFKVMDSMLQGAFASNVLPIATKALMFAVVARTLGCSTCEREAIKLLAQDGLSEGEIETAVATLQWKGLAPQQSGLLSWARNTVYYETGKIQPLTRQLGAAIGDAALLEAIGVAALANATVRLGMLVE